MTGVLGTMDLSSTTQLSAEQSQWLDVRGRADADEGPQRYPDFLKIEGDQIKFEAIDFPLQQVVLEVVRLFERLSLEQRASAYFGELRD